MGNNRDLPKYEKSVAIQPTQMIDAESSANAMINAFQNFSSSVAQVSQKISKDEADARRETIKNNIDNTYKGFAMEALRNPDQNAALADFQKKSQQYRQGMLETSDHYNKPYVSNLVDYYSNEHQYSIEKNAILQNQRVQQVEANERISNANMSWKAAVQNSVPPEEGMPDTQFDIPAALLADTIRNMKQDAIRKNLPPEAMNKQAESMMKDFYEEVFLKRYQDNVKVGRGNDFIKEVANADTHIPGYGTDDKTKLIAKMIKIRDQGHKSAKLALGQYKRDIAHELYRVGHDGATPNQKLVDDVTAINENAGLDLAYNQKIQQQVYANTQATINKTPEGVEQFKRNLAPKDVNSPTYGEELDVYNKSVKAIDQYWEEFKANPMVETMKDPGIQEVVNNYEQAFNANAATSDGKYSPFNTSVPKPWDYVIDSQLHAGLTLNGGGSKNGKAGTRVRLIDESKTTDMVNEITSADAPTAIAYMNKLRDEYGEGLPFNLVIKQLVDAGMPAKYAMAVHIDPNSVDAVETMKALKFSPTLLASELKKRGEHITTQIAHKSQSDVFSISGGGTTNFKAFMGTLTRHTGDADGDYMASIQQTVEQIAGYKVLVDGKTPANAVAEAEDIIANRYSYTSLGNQKVRIPKTLPAQTVKDFAAEMEKGVPDFPFNLEGSDKARAKIAIEHGYWRNDNVDHGMVWVDSNGVMWSDKNGHPYSFSFDEARTGMPDKRTPEVTGNTHAGMLLPGNIDLENRPKIYNADGTFSTVDTITIERDGKTILLPTIVDGKKLSKEEAIKHYKETHEHMGIFVDQSHADAYDKALHEAKGWTGKGNKWDDGSDISTTAQEEASTGVAYDQGNDLNPQEQAMMKRGKKMGTKVHELLTQANKGKL